MGYGPTSVLSPRKEVPWMDPPPVHLPRAITSPYSPSSRLAVLFYGMLVVITSDINKRFGLAAYERA